jgi:hypothetical protein
MRFDAERNDLLQGFGGLRAALLSSSALGFVGAP